jgi:cytochrome c oxidase subunit 2
MKIAIVLILLVIGSVIFHFASPWYLTPIASNWGMIDDTIDITFWVTGFVFVAVNLFLAYSVYKYQYKKNAKADYEPENSKLEIILTVITSVGVAAMLAPGLFVWSKIINVPEEAHVVEAIGQQWQWTYRFPGKDEKMGKVHNSLVTPSNPFGINPKDPDGQDDILVGSNDVHLPIDLPVKFLLRSKDVLHNFAVAQFRVKMDLVPGTVTYLWFIPNKLGTYEVLCEELCGVAHFTMRGHVIVDTVEDFQAWLATQPTFAQTQQTVTANPEAGKASFAICASCHGQNGEGLLTANAPSIAGMPEYYLARQLNYYKKGIRGAHKDDSLGQSMAAMANILADDAAVNNVAAYVHSLTPTKAAPTISGDTKRGYSNFVTCSSCHGASAQGNPGLNAPPLAGQHDWYLKHQLENFKTGIRGNHKDDLFGTQMRLMSKILRDEQAVNDLVAYINTLQSE